MNGELARGSVSIGSPALFIGFVALVVVMLALDLGVFHRSAHRVGFREAAVFSGIWVALALVFNLAILVSFGSEPAIEFLTGYLIEKSLSVDNLLVFVVVFAALGIPRKHQHRVLYFGMISALVLRATMIFAGVALLRAFHFVMYLFGGFLILTGIRVFRAWRRQLPDGAESTRLLEAVRRFVPSSSHLDGQRFFTVERGRRVATPLLVALVLLEIGDVLFAFDSIPAVFAVTRDPFIVFTSNIFAILGLRSLFSLVSGLIRKFHYLKLGLSAVLVFIGAKMALSELVHIGTHISLAVIAVVLGASIVASVRRRDHNPRASFDSDGGEHGGRRAFG